jgi:hypothetical protein
MWFPTGFRKVGGGIAAAIPLIVINKEHVMNTKLLIASLLLGSSSVAMASPSVTFSAKAEATYGTTSVRDHRDPTPTSYGEGHVWRGERKPLVHRPVLLASNLQFARDGRTFITVGDQMGRFQALQIKSGAGRTLIKQVYVQFENGQEQVIRNVDRMLYAHQSMSLDLDGNRRAIRRIVVYGNDVDRGWNRWRPAGTFSVTGS